MFPTVATSALKQLRLEQLRDITHVQIEKLDPNVQDFLVSRIDVLVKEHIVVKNGEKFVKKFEEKDQTIVKQGLGCFAQGS